MKGIPQNAKAGSLHEVTRRVASRRRMEWLKGGLAKAAMAVAIGASFWVATLIFFPSWIAPFPQWMLGVVGALGVMIALVMFRQIDPKALHHAMDQQLGLPDLALTAGELEGKGDDATSARWIQRQREDALERLRVQNWREVWPVPWPKWSGFATAVSFLMLGLLSYLHLVEGRFLNRPRPTLVFQERRAAAMDEVFKEWEEEVKYLDGEDRKALEELLQKIAPIRERLADSRIDEKQLFTELNRIELMVAAEKARLEAESLEHFAGPMAESLESVEGMGALSSALRRKDFKGAEERAEKLEAKLQETGAKIPEGAGVASEAIEKVGQELQKSGQQQMGQGMQKLSEGARQNDPKKMGEGMQNLKEGLQRENSRKGEQQRLATQLSQLANLKEEIGKGELPGTGGRPSLASQREKERGKGAGKGIGTESDPHLFGEETRLDSERRVESLTGKLGEGKSETTTVKTTEGQGEVKRDLAEVSFQEYERLSRQAVEDENIPAVHRQVIKRYFERIRPDAPPSVPISSP